MVISHDALKFIDIKRDNLICFFCRDTCYDQPVLSWIMLSKEGVSFLWYKYTSPGYKCVAERIGGVADSLNLHDAIY